ncbi:MAG: anthranilate synthase component I family protein [Zetaproteobacteria bacterium]|nr:MAG: anthranilate synthase component I family protein [Zetaproteobacteria bacterium]
MPVISPVEWSTPRANGDAFSFFARHYDHCAALLEDPSGAGRQIVVSRAGTSLRLDGCEKGWAERWRKALHRPRRGGAGIALLFYLSYEAGGLFERLPAPKAALDWPLIYAHAPEWSLTFSADSVVASARDDTAAARLRALLTLPPRPLPPPVLAVGSVEECGSAATYRAAVEQVQHYIRRGDIFQANIARFWRAPLQRGDDLALYGRLRRRNPAPFCCLLRLDAKHSIISSSPERLFRITPDGTIDTRPIAGTRRLGRGKERARLRRELLLSDKERAEHVMLVDLERNDLGRICRPGSVAVDESMVIERYATVQHIVSNVRGRLRDGVDLIDVLATMFPGGTITGCPKIRCMEIIHELEPGPRGPYTGGVGYVACDGSVDCNILIRTFWRMGDMLCWAAGAGIVSDSIAEHEQRETEHKAAGLLAALQNNGEE